MSDKPVPLTRRDFRHFDEITTRWSDNDAYGHVNNIYYFGFFDTTVTRYLVHNRLLDYRDGKVVGLAVESHCNYFAPVAFPAPVTVGLRVGRLGNSSVRYELGIFSGDDDRAAAQGHFVHVYVERASQKPVALDPAFRAALEPILV